MKLLAFAFLLGLNLSGCEKSNEAIVEPESFGLMRTSIDSDLVDHAIEVANTILGVDQIYPFRRDFSPQKDPRQIPVFILSSFNLSGADVIWVPLGCRCVYIQAPALRRWLDKAQQAEGYGDPFDEKYVVGFMLLHELGHITNDTSEKFLTSDDAKLAESVADAFVETELLKRLASGGSQAQAASAIVRNTTILSNNIYNSILLNQGLSEILCLEPTIYWDWGFSHPNLVFRLTDTVNRLAPSPQLASIVADFKNCRAKEQKYFDMLR